MEKIIFPTVITAVTIICICVAWCFFNWAKHKERLLMIEKGINPNEREPGSLLPQRSKIDYNRLLKIGVVVFGLGLGLIVTIVLSSLRWITSDIAGFGIMILFCGISLIVASHFGKAKVNGI